MTRHSAGAVYITRAISYDKLPESSLVDFGFDILTKDQELRFNGSQIEDARYFAS